VKHHDVTPEESDRWIQQAAALGHVNPKLLVALVSGDENVLRVLRELTARSESPNAVESFARATDAGDWIERRLAFREHDGPGNAARR
jgi:hypothetical protein